MLAVREGTEEERKTVISKWHCVCGEVVSSSNMCPNCLTTLSPMNKDYLVVCEYCRMGSVPEGKHVSTSVPGKNIICISCAGKIINELHAKVSLLEQTRADLEGKLAQKFPFVTVSEKQQFDADKFAKLLTQQPIEIILRHGKSICPVCRGTGTTSMSFQDSTKGGCYTATCRACDGKCVI